MPKRKNSVDVQLWKHGCGAYIVPFLPDTPSDYLQQVRNIEADATLLFIRDGNAESLLVELSSPSIFANTKSDYFIVPARQLEGDCKVTLGRYIIEWKNAEIWCRGSKVCVSCFFFGVLWPETCRKHLTCEHNTHTDGCRACLSQTLLGYWPDYTRCVVNAPKLLKNYGIRSGKTLEFQCSVCRHVFQKKN